MSKIVNLNAFKKNKTEKAMYEPKANEDFGDRMTRIRASLDRINVLMAELRKMSASDKPTRETDEEII